MIENKTSPDTWVCHQPCLGNAVLPTGHFFPPLLAFPGPCLYMISLSHQQISSQVLSNEEFNCSHLKKWVPTDFLPAHAGPPAMPLSGSAHRYSGTCTHTLWSPEHTNPSDPQPLGYWRYHNSFFSQRQARKDDRNCVCSQKTSLNWFRGKKIELCMCFFSCL